jgi:hypothetical protein
VRCDFLPDDYLPAPEDRELFGPFDDPDAGRQELMHSTAGFTPKRADYLKAAAPCAILVGGSPLHP